MDCLTSSRGSFIQQQPAAGAWEELSHPISLLKFTFLPLSPSQPPSAAPVCRSDPGPTAESEREDACARARGSRCAVGAPGRPRARQRVGAADGDTRAPKVRVCAAEAKGSDRHCGSQRRAQPATLPGHHGEAGVPEGAHSDLVRDAETPPTKHNRRNPVHASCACIFLNFSFASFPSSRRAFPAHGAGDCAACLLIILINSNNAPALTDLLLWAFFLLLFNDVLTSRVCRLLNCTEERR